MNNIGQSTIGMNVMIIKQKIEGLTTNGMKMEGLKGWENCRKNTNCHRYGIPTNQ